MYAIKEIYKTIQGEGAQSGRTAVFVRFSGCNLWTGREKHRESAVCQFCDTDFVGTDGLNGGSYSAKKLLEKIELTWGEAENRLIVFTGGEPMLQLDKILVEKCKKLGFEIAIETNGTIAIEFDIDWVCVSPKYGSELVVKEGNELKVVFPQLGQNLDDFLDLSFDHLFLQPMDGNDGQENTVKTIQYCLENPQWKLSIQQHKLIGMP
jgi:7-carboxy-7-deazaguanine synthase (Cx14CxxC type)